MEPTTLSILGIGLWTGGLTRPEQLLEAAHLSAEEINQAVPEGAAIDKRARRRASPLSRAAADSFVAACEQAGFDPGTVSTVFASALGETPAMIDLVDQVCRGQEMSPMKFAVSVHSSSSTVVSINHKNRRFTSSISSNYDTVAAGLFEMAALLATGHGPGVLVFADDHSPDQFLREDERYCRVTGALALLRSQDLVLGQRVLGTVTLPSTEVTVAVAGPVVLPGLMTRSPLTGALDLVAALLGTGQTAVRLDRGQGSGYMSVVTPAAAGVTT